MCIFCKYICICDVTICVQICQSRELQGSWTDTGAQIHPPEKAEIPTMERVPEMMQHITAKGLRGLVVMRK